MGKHSFGLLALIITSSLVYRTVEYVLDIPDLYAYLLGFSLSSGLIIWYIQTLYEPFRVYSKPAFSLPMTGLFLGFFWAINYSFQVLSLLIMMGLYEEVLFHYAFVTIGELLAWSKRQIILGSSVAFGLFHLLNITNLTSSQVLTQVVAATVAGVFFAVLYFETRSLFGVTLIHVLTNILGTSQSWQINSNDAMNTAIIYAILVAFAALLCLLTLRLCKRFPTLLYIRGKNLL